MSNEEEMALIYECTKLSSILNICLLSTPSDRIKIHVLLRQIFSITKNQEDPKGALIQSIKALCDMEKEMENV